MSTIKQAVATAGNLKALCAALNAFEPSSPGERLEDAVDLCGLPTFGGVAPSDTRDVWSWDADNVLLFNDGYHIEKRNPDAWYDRKNAA